MIEVSPLLALGCDVIGTCLAQIGYVCMKLGHLSKEDSTSSNSNQTPTQLKDSGYCTLQWIIGLFCLIIGCAIHAGKSLAPFLLTS